MGQFILADIPKASKLFEAIVDQLEIFASHFRTVSYYWTLEGAVGEILTFEPAMGTSG